MTSRKTDKPSDPKRRSFLRNTGASALVVGSTGVLSAASASARPADTRKLCKTPGCDYDAVVVGGGFAGVTAARDLQQNGYKTLLLEARNRLGGRTFSSTFADHPVELGGVWIHWTQPFVWAEKERYGLEVMETPGAVPDTIILYFNGERKEATLEDIGQLAAAWDQYIAEGRRVWERPWDASHTWNEILERDNLRAVDVINNMDLTSMQKSVLKGLVGSMVNNAPDTASHLEVLRWGSCCGWNFTALMDSVARYKLKDGTISLIDQMIADAKPEVHLANPVKRIEDRGDHVRITTVRGERITAATVLVTVPMNVIDGIEFSPALDGKLIAAAKETHAGAGFKVYMITKGKVGNITGFGDETSPFTAVLTYEEAEDHTLLVAFGGDKNRLDIHDGEAVQEAARAFLPEVEIESTYSYVWDLDPYSKGTWCSYRPGWFSKYYAIFQKDEGRIFFGQGDHGEGWRGLIDGAIGAGTQAAQRVHKFLS